MVRRKKNMNKVPIIIGTVIVVVALAIAGFTITTGRDLTFIEKAIRDTGLFFSRIVSPTPSQREIDNIRRQIEEQHAAYIREIEEQLVALKELNNLENTLHNYDIVNATVISRNVNFWFDDIIIDKGRTSGVDKNMPVIVNGRLIGIVTSVSNFTSTIRLLSSSELTASVSVKIETEDGYAFALLTGYDHRTNTYIVEGLGGNNVIVEGALVTTTGLGDRFPAGIIVGRVETITSDNFDLARILMVSTDIDINNLRFVTILNRKAPHQ